MASAADLRAEAARCRELARKITDRATVAQLEALAMAIEARAKEMDNGDGEAA